MNNRISRLISSLASHNHDPDPDPEEALFRCSGCFAKDKIVYTYESAEESEFKCDCGNQLQVQEDNQPL